MGAPCANYSLEMHNKASVKISVSFCFHIWRMQAYIDLDPGLQNSRSWSEQFHLRGRLPKLSQACPQIGKAVLDWKGKIRKQNTGWGTRTSSAKPHGFHHLPAYTPGVLVTNVNLSGTQYGGNGHSASTLWLNRPDKWQKIAGFCPVQCPGADSRLFVKEHTQTPPWVG